MSKERTRGTAFETAVVRYLQHLGVDAERTGSASSDLGDISLVDYAVAVECKNHKALDLAGWLAQVHAACNRLGFPIAAVIHKRRGHGTANAYVTMSLDSFILLLKGEHQ